jgi:hypothetical protein
MFPQVQSLKKQTFIFSSLNKFNFFTNVFFSNKTGPNNKTNANPETIETVIENRQFADSNSVFDIV